MLPALLTLLASAVLATRIDSVRPAVASDQSVVREIRCMGTTLTLRIAATTREHGLLASEAAIRACLRVEARLSTWTNASELSRLNANPVDAQFPISRELRVDLALARRHHAATSGAFDPSVGALIDAWKLRSGGARPSALALSRARSATSFELLTLKCRAATRRHPQLRLDAGAFGKGRALDAAVRALRAQNIRRAVLDFGGQIACFGGHHRFGIADPRHRNRIVTTVRVPTGSIATSGNSERGIVIDGERLGHILDPRTGQPAADFGSLTVWTRDATQADCLSTGLYVLGPEAAIRWAEAREGVECLAVVAATDTSESRVLGTRAFLEWLEDSNQNRDQPTTRMDEHE